MFRILHSLLAIFFLSFPLTRAMAQLPNWAEDIAPMIYENCSSCHHVGGIGAFPLMSLEDVILNGPAIYHEVDEDRMPPWPADPDYMHFVGEQVLSTEEKEDLLFWLDTGMPSGDLDLAPDPPVYLPSGSLLDQIDHVVAIEPYTVQTNVDEYRWFAIENTYNDTFYISKLEVIPGLPNVVHHADLFLDFGTTSMDNDLADPLPGFNSNTGFAVNNQYINAWQPGAALASYPPGWGIAVPPDATLVIEIHYGPGGIGQVDSTKMNIQFVPPGEFEREVKAAWLLNQAPNIFIDGPLALPPNELSTFHQIMPPLQNDLSLISICPHMHFLGKSYKVWYEDQNGIEHPLIDIPTWDFHWQKYYTYLQVNHIPAGSVIKSEAVYDNTTENHDNPNDPPIWVYSGLNTTDEMFLCYFIYADYEPGDEDIALSLYDHTANAEGSLLGMRLYPNPTNDLVHIGGMPAGALYSVIDVRGRRYDCPNTGSSFGDPSLDCSDLRPGMYWVHVTLDDEVLTLPFVKN